MKAKTLNPFPALAARLKARWINTLAACQAWLGTKSALIWLGICTATFIAAMVLPRGWVRGSGDLVRVNLIDFFVRGVVVPEVIFFAALAASKFVRIKWLPAVGVLCAAAAWYAGVLTSSAWLFFVEHVQGTISTTFVDFLTRERLVTTIELVAAPLALFGATFDVPAMVSAATSPTDYADAVTVMWRDFVLLSLFVYAVLPRLILVAATVIGTGVSRATAAVVEQVRPWQPQFSRPKEDASLEWFESSTDEQMFTKALIVTALRSLPVPQKSVESQAQADKLTDSLDDHWRRFTADEAAWRAYLRGVSTDACPKLHVLAFDAARYNFVRPTPDGTGYALDSQALPRVLATLLGNDRDWQRVQSALAEVPGIERELSKDPASWKKWLYIAGAGAGAAAGAVALAPFLGVAGLCALGGGAVAKGGLGILGGKLVLAAAGGAVGTAAGAALPLKGDDASQVLVQVMARQIALVVNDCVTRSARAAVIGWLSAMIEAPTGDTESVAKAKTAKRALHLLQQHQ